jgi:hypothetical protein
MRAALVAWLIATVIVSWAVRAHFQLSSDPALDVVVATVWAGGQVVGRAAVAHPGDTDPELDAALATHVGAERVDEVITGQGPILRWAKAMALSFVPGRDGIAATLDGRTAYVTPDELLARQAYDKGIDIPALQLSVGLDVELALALLGDRLHVPVPELRDRAELRRIRTTRVQHPNPTAPTPETLSDLDVRAGAEAAARYLVRGLDAHGRFRYMVDAPTNQTRSGYDWPRHSGATYFVAQVASLTGDPELRSGALRAAVLLRDGALVDCGGRKCIGEGRVVDVGSSALGLLAFVEIVRDKLGYGFDAVVPQLADFLRSQQRPDGEFMHQYDRAASAPIDVQLLYYSGEAAFALGRAHSLASDPRDLEASLRSLDYLVHHGWSFFGSRYYWGEEHWTCQALDELTVSGAAPDERAVLNDALDFCLDWAAYGRHLMYGPGDAAFDADGAYGFGPVITPRLTPAGSRSEAGIATLHAARRLGRPATQLQPLEEQLRRSLAMLLRHQFRPGPVHLFADPQAVEGAMPGSEVDWALRIDYAQHSGSALVRWLELTTRP